MNVNDLWEQLGELSEENSNQTLMRLFASYEEDNEKELNNEYCEDFFKRLKAVINQSKECNISRR
ncbi:MAG: hypothetical protein OCC45_07545 [Desulfotalea sp.]